jgi:para-aminobenzoate synthetase component 1
LLAAVRACVASPTLMLDGRAPVGADWGGPLVALSTRVVLSHRHSRIQSQSPDDPFEQLEALALRRRAEGGTAETGLLALLGYELTDRTADPSRDRDGLPEMVVLSVDESVRYPHGATPVWTSRGGPATSERRLAGLLDDARPLRDAGRPRPLVQPPRTSLARERYLRAVEQVREHIRRGDCYQANLTQHFELPFDEDPFRLYRRLLDGGPAPRSAFVDCGEFALVSASPETFVRVEPDGRVETRPIKGTRPRSPDPETDLDRARELLASGKDRAELLMIVDLERNDLGRVCVPGSVHVAGELVELESFPAVHHLMSRVRGRLRRGQGPAGLLRASFPGGSITGAPKLRVMDILKRLEPVRRNFYTGCLVWLGDDGTIDSSILIRSIVTGRGRARLGAGGGVVVDSEPESEWLESNHKARPLTRALGFEPEEAG